MDEANKENAPSDVTENAVNMVGAAAKRPRGRPPGQKSTPKVLPSPGNYSIFLISPNFRRFHLNSLLNHETRFSFNGF